MRQTKVTPDRFNVKHKIRDFVPLPSESKLHDTCRLVVFFNSTYNRIFFQIKGMFSVIISAQTSIFDTEIKEKSSK